MNPTKETAYRLLKSWKGNDYIAGLYGMMQLQRKVKVEKFFGGKNRHQERKHLPSEPIIVTNHPIGEEKKQ